MWILYILLILFTFYPWYLLLTDRALNILRNENELLIEKLERYRLVHEGIAQFRAAVEEAVESRKDRGLQ